MKGAGLAECDVKARKLELRPKTHWHQDAELRPDESRWGQRSDGCHHESLLAVGWFQIKSCVRLTAEKTSTGYKIKCRVGTGLPVRFWFCLLGPDCRSSICLHRLTFYNTTLLLLLGTKQVCILQWQEQERQRRDCFQSGSGEADGNEEEISVSAPCFDLRHNIVELSWMSLTSGAATCSLRGAPENTHTHTQWKQTPHCFISLTRNSEKKIYCVGSAKKATNNIFQFCFWDTTNLGTFACWAVLGSLQNLLFCLNDMIVINVSELKILQNLIA